MHIAAINGDMKLVDFYIDIDRRYVSARNVLGQTPLMFAAMAGRTDVAKRLLDAGASGTTSDLSYASALRYASENGNLEFVELISKNEQMARANPVVFRTAAATAMDLGHEATALYLYSLGTEVDLNYGDPSNKALELMANGWVYASRFIQNKFGVDGSYSDRGFNFLHAAAGYADSVLLEELKDNGASISKETDRGLTPLLIACGVGKSKSHLLAHGERREYL